MNTHTFRSDEHRPGEWAVVYSEAIFMFSPGLHNSLWSLINNIIGRNLVEDIVNPTKNHDNQEGCSDDQMRKTLGLYQEIVVHNYNILSDIKHIPTMQFRKCVYMEIFIFLYDCTKDLYSIRK